MSVLKSLLSIAALFFIGYPVIYYLLLSKSPVAAFRGFSGGAFIFFISFYTGILFATIYLIVLSIASVDFSLVAVVIFSSVFFVFSIYLIVKQEMRIRHTAVNDRQNDAVGIERLNCHKDSKPANNLIYRLYLNKKLLNAVYAFVFFLILINFMVVVFFTFLFPIRFWDAVSCWSLKGRAFFIDGSIYTFFTGHDYVFTHQSYPLYVPLLQTWIYIWLGYIDETLVKVIFPVFYISLVFLFYYIFRQKFNRLFSLIIIFIISALPVVVDHGYIEYTNLVFSIILFLGVYYFYLYVGSRQQKANLLVLSSMFFAMLTQIRSEGAIFLVIFLIINTVTSGLKIYRNHKEKKAGLNRSGEYRGTTISIISPLFLVFFLMLPWLYTSRTLGLPLLSKEWSDLFLNVQGQEQGVFGIFNLGAALKAIGAGLFYSSFDSARAFLGSSYGVVWFILLVILIINFKRSVENYNWIFPIFIISGFISLIVSFSLIHEFIWSTDRYLLHLLPLTYFWIFYNLPLFKNKDN